MNEVNIFEALGIAWRRKFLIAALVIAAAVSAYFISAAQPSIYEAETTLVVPAPGPSSPIPGLGPLPAAGRLPTLPGALDSSPVSTALLLPLLRSRVLGERVVRACGLLQEYRTGSIQGATALLKRDTTISPDPTGAIVVSVKAKKPRVAADIANCYAVELRKVAEEKIDLSMLRRSRAYVERQLAQAQRRLAAAEERVKRYQEEHQIVALPDEARAAVEHIASLERDRTSARIQLRDTNARLAEKRRQIEAQTSQPVEDLPAHSPVIQNLRDDLMKLNAELALAQEEFTDAYPAVQSLKAQIAEKREQIGREVDRVRRSLKNDLAPELTPYEVDRIATAARAAAVERALARVQWDAGRLPSEALQLARLTREQQVQEALYTMLVSEQQKVRLLDAREGPPFVVLDAAVVPEGRLWPRPNLIALLAAILACVVGLTLAFFLEYAERARYAREKRAYLAQTPEEIPSPNHVTPRV